MADIKIKNKKTDIIVKSIHSSFHSESKITKNQSSGVKLLKMLSKNCNTFLANLVLLAHPRCSSPLAIQVDAFNFAIGCFLEQEEENHNCRPLAFFAKKLSTTHQSYSTYDRELLAIYLTVRQLKHMLQKRQFGRSHDICVQ